MSPKIRGICSAGSFLTESSRVFAALADYSKSASKMSVQRSNMQAGTSVATSNEVTSSKKTLYRIEEKEERDDPLKGSDSIQAAESSAEVHEMPTFPNDASQLRKDIKRASSFDLHGGANLDVLIESSSTIASHTASLSSASTTRSDASDKHRRLSVFLMHGKIRIYTALLKQQCLFNHQLFVFDCKHLQGVMTQRFLQTGARILLFSCQKRLVTACPCISKCMTRSVIRSIITRYDTIDCFLIALFAFHSYFVLHNYICVCIASRLVPLVSTRDS